MTYTNGAAAMFLVGFWPALVLAARREVPLAARAGGLAAAAATLAAWLVTQSKGGGIALALSAVAVLVVSRDRLRLLVPGAIAGVLVGSQFHRLTAAYTSADLRAAARDAGLARALADRGGGGRRPALRARRPAAAAPRSRGAGW